MNELILIAPTEEYLEDLCRFRQEIWDAGDKDCFAGCSGLEQEPDILKWLETVRLNEHSENVPKGKVPSNVYLAVRKADNKIIGITDLRHHIDHPVLSLWGGHIGYTIRPSERGRGYGAEMLRLNLENCRRQGMSKVLITCSADNPASERVILANGGIFEKEVSVDGEIIKRYWITLQENNRIEESHYGL